MSARQQLIDELSRQPEQVAGQLLTYLHSLPGCNPGEVPAKPEGGNYWESYWSKVYGSCEGMDWPEPEEQPFEAREEW